MRAILLGCLLLAASPAAALLVVVEDLSNVRADTCVIGSEAGPPTFEDPILLTPPDPGTGWLVSAIYCGATYGAQYTIDPEAGTLYATATATTPYYLTYTDLTSRIDLWLVTDTDGWIEAQGTPTYDLNGQSFGGDATSNVLAGMPFRVTVSVNSMEPTPSRSGIFRFHPSVPEPGTAVLLALGLAIAGTRRRH